MTMASSAISLSSLVERRVSFHEALRAPVTVRRAFKVSAIVGTILIVINQGDLILAGVMPPLWKVFLTYLVPYCVSSYSTAALLKNFVAEHSRYDERPST